MSLSRLLCVVALCSIAAPAFGQAANDECINAIAVGEGAFVFDNTGDLVNGPIDCDANMSTDVWYLYTATLDGTAVIDTCATVGTLVDTTLIVYDATTLGACPVAADPFLACDDDGCGPIGFSSTVQIPVIAGNTYYVQVGGWNGSVGDATLTIALVETERFDGLDDDGDGDIDCLDSDCAAVPGCFEANCTDGLDDDLDGNIDCFDSDCAADAACLEQGNCGDAIDNDLDGDIDCADADCALDPLCVVILNDDCANAEIVGAGDTIGNNIPAILDGPIDCDANMSTDVWYSFTAAADGLYNVGTCNTVGTLVDTTLIVYAGAGGCPIAPDPGLACDDDGCGPIGFSSEVQVPLLAGEELLIQVGGWNGSTGDFTLTIEQLELICNDGIDDDLDGLIDCADPDCAIPCDESLACGDLVDNDLDGLIDCADPDCALDAACVVITNDNCIDAIAVTLGDTGFNNIPATLDGPIDCDANMSTDVWFTFSAPSDGTFSINTCGTTGSLTDTTLIVYDGAACPIAPDPGLACDDDSCGTTGIFNSEVVVSLSLGDSVLIQVGGWNGTTGDGTLTIAQEVSAPTAVTCTDSGVDVAVSWTDAAGGPGADSYNVYVNGAFVTNQPFGSTTFNTPYPAGGVGVVDVCVETVFGVDVSVQSCCSISIGGPANDECTTAIVAGLGDTAFDNTASTSNGPIDCDANMTTDVWFTHTVANDGSLNISTCNTVGTLTDTTLIVYDAATGCPTAGNVGLACDDDSCGPTGFNSIVTIPVIAGDELLIQVGGWNGTVGDGTLTIEQDCGDIGVATCTVNGAGDVDITWVDNANATLGYEIFENGISVGTAPAGSSSFTVVGPTGGLNTYEVTWTCVLGGGPGVGSNCSVTIVAPIPAGTTDVILANEDVALGLIDSGLALETALTAAGQTVYRVNSPDFDLSGLDFSIVDRVWCTFGTFPNDYRISQGEGDLLASLNAGGTGVYFEGGDHWGFVHQISLFDDRDGVDTALDGNDTFVSMDAVVGTAVDFSALGAAIPYNQDNAGNDWTDQLTVAAADLDVTLAEATWQQAGGGYLTGVYAEHATGANTLVQSWEFGGFGGDQNALAAAYLGQLGGGGPPLEQFIRGDANRDGGVNIADAIFVLGVLFPGAGGANVLSCVDAGDVNDDGTVNIADAIFLLGNLFPGPGGPPGIPAPSPACGVDPTADALDCATYANCP